MKRADAQPDTGDFQYLFLNDIPLIDTRAPVEFEKGAFPGSVSLPLMTNEERAKVGTCYKQQGQDAAIELGHQLVSGEAKQERVDGWADFAKRNPQGYLYCWRGGLRSQICQQWLAERGCDYPRIRGGYKAMRRYLIDQFQRIVQHTPLLVLGGRTGCNKTAFVEQKPQAVDLEGLAHHRGSSFGRRPDGQPTQLNFENALAVAMLKAEQAALQANLPILLEDESKLVGRCSLPSPLREAMLSAPLVLLEVPLAERVEHSYQNYILNKLKEWENKVGPEQSFGSFADDLTQSLFRVRKRLGGVRYQEIKHLMEQALDQHRQGKPDAHREWIRSMLEDYYDPMYDYQLSRRQNNVVFRGNRTEVEAFLMNTSQEGLPVYYDKLIAQESL